MELLLHIFRGDAGILTTVIFGLHVLYYNVQCVYEIADWVMGVSEPMETY